MFLLVIFVQVNKSNSSKDKGSKFTGLSHTVGHLVVLIPGLIFWTEDRCPCCGGHRDYPFSLSFFIQLSVVNESLNPGSVGQRD